MQSPVILVVVSLWLVPIVSGAAPFIHTRNGSYRADRILVKQKSGISQATLANFHAMQRAKVLRTFADIGNWQVLGVPQGETVKGLVAKYRQSRLVELAEPDYEVHADLAPNDPRYLDGTLWGLNNYGQNGGTPGADIDAPAAWDVLTSASNVVVAVVDSGIRYTHEDLASNMWVNPSDGSHGWNAIAGTNDPYETNNGHGTLMAGIIGAVGNNGVGVVGVAWHVQLMACKCLDSSGNGSDSDFITCIDYARTNGAEIINASLSGTEYSQALYDAISRARDDGIIFVTSAGNANPGINIDVNPTYPACYPLDNIVSVAYTTRTDDLGMLSNYGATNVDLAAPGDQIYSTYDSSDTSYYPPFNFINVAGTSYAAAYVSGAFALLRTKYPAETYQQIINRVLAATDPLPSLTGKCVTGGRLNLRNALSPLIRLTVTSTDRNQPFQLRVSTSPGRVCVIETSTNLATWSPVSTNVTSAIGVFDFTNTASAGSSLQLFRAMSSP